MLARARAGASRSRRDATGNQRAAAFEFTLRLDYEIGNGMRIRASVINDGPAAMPFGFGLHPYFNLPLDRRARRQVTRLLLPAQKRWLLSDDLIPEGSVTGVDGKYDLRGGEPIGDRSFDDAFCAVTQDADGLRRGRLIEPTMKIALEVSADSSFDNWVIYAPPDRGVLAIEPYTCAPDAFNLASRGIDAGMIKIAPGAAWSGTIEFKLVAA